MLAHVYRVTKYDPTDRDRHGHYTGTEEALSDHGPVEAAYLEAVAAFAAETGIDCLTVREPQLGAGFAGFGAGEPAVESHGLDRLFPPGRAGYHDGAQVSLALALELVRAMLRGSGAWCRLEVEGRFTIHVGWDQYVYVASVAPCAAAVARTRALGLFPERLEASPTTPRSTSRAYSGPLMTTSGPESVGASRRARRRSSKRTTSATPRAGTGSMPTPWTTFELGWLLAPAWPSGLTFPPT